MSTECSGCNGVVGDDFDDGSDGESAALYRPLRQGEQDDLAITQAKRSEGRGERNSR